MSAYGDFEKKNEPSGDEFDPFGLDGDEKEPPGRETVNVAAYGFSRAPDVVYGELSFRKTDDGKTGLAVATEVDDSRQDGLLLQPAFEYEPNSKPSIVRNRRFHLYAVAGITILIALIIGAAFIGMNQKNTASQVSSGAPGMASHEKSYRDQFVAEVGEQVMRAGSPYDRAANWIMNEDPVSLSPDAPNLIQRYHLALFYFLTTDNGKKRWNSCNPPRANESETCIYQDIEFSDTLVEYTVYKNVSDSIRWMSDTHECDWTGAFCDDADNIIALQICKCHGRMWVRCIPSEPLLTHTAWAIIPFSLAGQNCTGALPTELAQLPYLQAIALYHNEFTGTLPHAYAGMKQLVSLELHYNELTSTIPDAYWRSDSLQHLNLGSNLLSGAISNKVVMLGQMKGLYLFDNT